MSNDNIALELIEKWENSTYNSYSQRKACLQVAIIEGLEAKDKEIKKWQKEALQQYPTPEAYQAVCDVLEANKKELTDFRELLLAVNHSTFDGFSFEDVSGGNWWDVRRKLLTKVKNQ